MNDTNKERLIYANKLMERLTNWKLDCLEHSDFETASVLDDCMCELDAQPTIGAVEVVYAHWVWNPNGNDWGIGAWCCSKCGGKNDALPWDNKLNPYAFACSHFCPVCGAHMDGDGNV